MNHKNFNVKRLSGREGRVPGLQRGLEILEYLKHCPEGSKIVSIASALKIPGNSTIRVLTTLADFGYVERDPESLVYRLTRKMMALAIDSARDRTLMECAVGVMRELRDRVGESVVLSVMDGSNCVVMEHMPSLHSFRFVCDPGHHQVLHVSASPKVMLAFMSPEVSEAILAQHDFQKYTGATITTRAAFNEEMAVIRQNGYSLDRGEQMEGMHCAAAPVLDRRGIPVAALTVTGPSFRLTLSDLPKLGALTREHADRIAVRFCGAAGKNG